MLLESFTDITTEDFSVSDKEMLAERLLADITSQLDLIDPTDEGDELLNHLFNMYITPDGYKFLGFLIGVEDLDDYAREIAEDLAEELE